MKKSAIAWILLLMLCLSACVYAENSIQDRAGNTITIPDTVNAIVSLAPAITSVLVDVGLSDKLVAVDTYSAMTIDLPQDIMQFDMMAPDLEQIVALSPDLVLVSNMTLVDGKDALYGLADMGIQVAFIPSSASIQAIIEDVRFIGLLVGRQDEAEALCTPLLDSIAAHQTDTDNLVSVYFEIGSSPAFYTFGSDTFLNDLIEIVGGQNIFAERSGWLSVSEEAIIAFAPDIIFTNEEWVENATEAILARPGWQDIPAVQNGNVFFIDNNASSQPSHHVVEALNAMAEAILNMK